MEKKLLEVGDILYQHHQYGKGVNKFTVTRVSPTQAILNDGNKTKREILSSTYGKAPERYVCAYGSYRHYYLETTQLKERHEWWLLNRATNSLLKLLDCDQLNIDQLQKLHSLLLTFQPITNEQT